MRVGLHDADGTRFPNLALMKLSMWHKCVGDTVEIYSDDKTFDKVYSSKVFTFTEEATLPKDTEKAGVGRREEDHELPHHIEHILPDYSLYQTDFSLGFLTRGCIRKCPWCVVPKKEGTTKPHADVEEFLYHKNVVLMDNNVLSHDHGIQQIEKMTRLKVKVDFNQGLDARLIDRTNAKILSKLKWLKPIRLACDSLGQMKSIEEAVRLLRWENATPRQYFCYCLIGEDMQDAVERIMFLKGLHIDPFAQPYIDEKGTPPKQWQKHLARWVNNKAEFNSRTWEEYYASKQRTNS